MIETGDVRFLLIRSNYDELPDIDIEELSNAWYNIYTEFSRIVGGNRADLWLVKRKRLVSMQLKYQLGATILRAVQICPAEETIEAAREFGYMLEVDNLEKTFEKAYTQLMRLKNNIQSIENDYKQEAESDEKDDFDSLIAILEKYQGYQFDELKMTVKKFANIYKNYKDAREQTRKE